MSPCSRKSKGITQSCNVKVKGEYANLFNICMEKLQMISAYKSDIKVTNLMRILLLL